MPRARQRIKSILSKCVICRKVQGRHYMAPPTAPLPADRVLQSKPFTVIGIDYTGAIPIKHGDTTKKVYMALFTCAITRAVHLEIVEDGTEQEFLRAFRRFVSRKSFPSVIYSDNAKIFISANKTLKDIAESTQVSGLLQNYRIVWKFIPARASWFGGMYERLIGLTKTLLKKTLGSTLSSLSELSTLVAEVECRINLRPLTYVSSDQNEPLPLSPSQLIYGYRPEILPTAMADETMNPTYSTGNNLRRKLAQNQRILEVFWSRWVKEYLVALRERDKNLNCTSPKVSVGDVVLVEDCVPRVNWKMAIVSELFQGRDGVVRSVKLKTNNGYITRPILKCYPLEIHCDDYKLVLDNDNTRPLRQAAIRARRAIFNSAGR